VGERSYGHNFKLSGDEKRAKKIGVLTPWPAKQQTELFGAIEALCSPCPIEKLRTNLHGGVSDCGQGGPTDRWLGAPG
jgi:hypothetical protein